MAKTQIVNVTVEELTKYGFKANGRFVNYSKNLSEADKLKVVPGAAFEGEYYIADSGKEYLNKVLQYLDVPAPVKVEKPVVKATAPKAAPQAEAPMTRSDWDKKDQRISRAGLIQAAVKAMSAYAANVDELFEQASSLADKMLEYVNR